jgi:hypothetical protein
MAQLPPDGQWIIQLTDNHVILFDRETEEELVYFDARDADQAAMAQAIIHTTDRLTSEQKCFAHFWSGYFYAQAKAMPYLELPT